MPLFLGLVGLGAAAGIFRLADETGDAVKSAVPLIVIAGGVFLVAKSQKWI